MQEPLTIFVAGPYSNGSTPVRERNVSIVHEIVKDLMIRGHIVLECHSLEHAFFADSDLMHEDFLRQTLNWLTKCDAIYFAGSSPGADLELAQAQELGLRVFRAMDEVPQVSDFQRPSQHIH